MHPWHLKLQNVVPFPLWFSFAMPLTFSFGAHSMIQAQGPPPLMPLCTCSQLVMNLLQSSKMHLEQGMPISRSSLDWKMCVYAWMHSFGVVRENSFGLSLGSRVILVMWWWMPVCKSSNKDESRGIISGVANWSVCIIDWLCIAPLHWHYLHFIIPLSSHPFFCVFVHHMCKCIMVEETISIIVGVGKHAFGFLNDVLY